MLPLCLSDCALFGAVWMQPYPDPEDEDGKGWLAVDVKLEEVYDSEWCEVRGVRKVGMLVWGTLLMWQ